MAGKIAKLIGSIFGNREGAATKSLFAPDYDDATKAMSKWVASWELDGVSCYVADEAGYRHAAELLKSSSRSNKLLMFIGHGTASGLMTKPSLGKPDSQIRIEGHGCLIDADDISQGLEGVHIVAWACDAGSYFGQRVASLKDSGFLGFNGSVNLVINHDESERLVWSLVLKHLFSRFSNKGVVEGHDAEWLSQELLSLRKAIKSGAINTGVHNRINTMFLKAAAARTVVHVSKGA